MEVWGEQEVGWEKRQTKNIKKNNNDKIKSELLYPVTVEETGFVKMSTTGNR